MGRGPLGFTLGFGPRGYPRRPPGQGRALSTGSELHLRHQPNLQFNEFTCAVRPRVAQGACGVAARGRYAPPWTCEPLRPLRAATRAGRPAATTRHVRRQQMQPTTTAADPEETAMSRAHSSELRARRRRPRLEGLSCDSRREDAGDRGLATASITQRDVRSTRGGPTTPEKTSESRPARPASSSSTWTTATAPRRRSRSPGRATARRC